MKQLRIMQFDRIDVAFRDGAHVIADITDRCLSDAVHRRAILVRLGDPFGLYRDANPAPTFERHPEIEEMLRFLAIG